MIPFLASAVLCMGLPAEGSFRYADLTPTMEILPRGWVTDSIARDIRHVRISGGEDSLVVAGFQGSEPFPVFGLSREITILDRGDHEIWIMDDLGYRIEKDTLGRPVLLTRVDTAGNPCSGPDGVAFVRWSWQSDSTVTVTSLNSELEPLRIKLSPYYTGTAARLNEQGDLVYFTFKSTSAWGLWYLIDGSGRMLSRRAVDSNGSVVETSEGIWEVRYRYDSMGNTVSTAFYDRSGVLLPENYSLPLEGNWEFDGNGVVENSSTMAFVEREYDGNCLYVAERNIGLDGNPTADREGRAVTLYEREIHGGITESRWYDLQGDRLEVAGIWATRRVYDRHGRVVESSTRDSMDRAAEFPGGFAFTRFSYTSRGDVAMISYYDLNGLPAVNATIGCHARDHSYDRQGNLTGIRYLGTDYRLMDNSAGYARAVFRYDEEGNLEEEWFYDEDGERLTGF